MTGLSVLGRWGEGADPSANQLADWTRRRPLASSHGWDNLQVRSHIHGIAASWTLFVQQGCKCCGR